MKGASIACMKRFLILPLSALIALGVAQAAQKPGKGNGKGRGKPAAVAVFRSPDRGMIADYYARSGGLPPGIAKKDDLPPGLAKQLRRNGTLPPGLQKKVMPLPMDLEEQLPPCPPYVRRGLLGGMAVMWNSRSGLILDAFVAFGH